MQLKIATFVVATLLAQAAHAAYDGFEEYGPVPLPLDDQNGGDGWSTDWNVPDDFDDEVTVQSRTPATAGGVSSGNQGVIVQDTGSTDDTMWRRFDTLAGPVYASVLIRLEGGSFGDDDFIMFQFTSATSHFGNNSNVLGFGFRNASGNPFYARVGSSSTGDTVLTSTSASAGPPRTFLLVAKMWDDPTVGGDGTDEYNRVDLFVYGEGDVAPTDEPDGSSADATASHPVPFATSLSYFNLRTFNIGSDDDIFIDELRVESSWADVIPEPTTAAMLGLVGLAMLRRRSA